MNRFSVAACKMDFAPCPFEVLTLRRYRPPHVAQVHIVADAPAHVASAAVRGKVIAQAGPWRSSGDWWQRAPWDHAEWDIAVNGGTLYRLYEDLRVGRWFIEGNYD
jgi:protein ImuB